MELTLEIPENKVSFVMELVESIPFIKVKKNISKKENTTEYLLSNPVNKKRLLDALERSRNNQVETHELIEE